MGYKLGCGKYCCKCAHPIHQDFLVGISQVQKIRSQKNFMDGIYCIQEPNRSWKTTNLFATRFLLKKIVFDFEIITLSLGTLVLWVYSSRYASEKGSSPVGFLTSSLPCQAQSSVLSMLCRWQIRWFPGTSLGRLWFFWTSVVIIQQPLLLGR